MPMRADEQSIRVYCPRHKVGFEASAAGKIVCANDAHVLAERFPSDGFWEYCCDCQRFWPSELKHGGEAQAICPVCERKPARRFLCEYCGVMSVASDNKHVKRRPYAIDASGAVGPGCPGCRAAAPASVGTHECEEAAVSFTTARAACPFCDQPFGEKVSVHEDPSFPILAADLLDRSGGGAQAVKPDILKGILVKDPDKAGALTLMHDWSVPGGILYVVPRMTRFMTRQDFYNLYEKFYDCARPGAGEVWVVRPAFVSRVGGGWTLRERGVLEVRAAAPRERPSKAEPKVKTKAPPKVGAEVGAELKTTAPAPPAPKHTPPPAVPTPAPARAADGPTGRAAAQTVVTPTPAEGNGRGTKPPEVPTRGHRRLAVMVAVVLTCVTIAGVIAAIASLVGRGVANRNAGSTSSSTPETPPAGGPPPGMVHVPGGTFQMGSDFEQFEKPPHDVTVAPFYMDEHEVMCEEYAAFVRATGHRPPPSWKGGSIPEGRARFPVTGVDWDDAVAYARWAGKRLPTEAEWEFAARGTDGRRYPWGDEWRADATNVKDSRQAGAANASLTEVMKHAHGVSPFGVHDMSGNAWEWTATDFGIYPGGDPSLMENQTAGKVIRGGCYLTGLDKATTTYRGKWPPRGKTYEQTGFRCVMDAPSR
jgi:formylglycine-generating enzyme required for sulfatase activity